VIPFRRNHVIGFLCVYFCTIIFGPFIAPAVMLLSALITSGTAVISFPFWAAAKALHPLVRANNFHARILQAANPLHPSI
jgi:hypothetical protein